MIHSMNQQVHAALPPRLRSMATSAMQNLICVVALVLWIPLALLLLTERPQGTGANDQAAATADLIADEDAPILEPES